MKKIVLLLVTAFILSSCASVPTEYFSPCACDFKTLKQEIEKQNKALT